MKMYKKFCFHFSHLLNQRYLAGKFHPLKFGKYGVTLPDKDHNEFITRSWVFFFAIVTLTRFNCQKVPKHISRQKFSQKCLVKYFDHLEVAVRGTYGPMKNILKVDKNNLRETPGLKSGISQGSQIAIKSYQLIKKCISLMFTGSASASSELLLCFVAYRPEHIWTCWSKRR